MNLTKKFYETHVGKWSESRDYAFFREKEFRNLIKHFKPGDSVIDIGCATANHVPLFLGIGRHLKYTGADISSAMLKVCRSRYPQLEFRYLDLADSKSFPKKKYNGFWASAVMMHVPWEQWPQMIRDITRMIKPGGQGYLQLPEERPNPRSKDDQRHFTLITPKEFKKFITGFGWQIKSSGHFVSRNNKTPWNWFIVKLP